TGKIDECLLILCAINSLISGGVALFLKRNYKSEDIKKLMSLNNPNWVIELAIRNMLRKAMQQRLKGKVSHEIIDRVACRIAAGAVAGSLVMKGSDSDIDTFASCGGVLRSGAMSDSTLEYSNYYSDGLISTAMSVAGYYVATVESENHSVTGSHANDFNPATGLAMTSDYFDAGGDAYGSALNHDSIFAYDNDISSELDSHSIDHGSSFNSGFDNYHDY
ncbi:hypothetical protein L4K04_003741, partial [Salmonella enterica]|nr:hypothetical protein [Salmonella enterica]